MLLETNFPSYIFRQQIILNAIVIVICISFILFLIIRFSKKIRTTNSRSKEIGKAILGVILILVFYLIFFFPEMKKTFSLKANGVETVGKTNRWINTNDSRMIEYSFEVEATVYTNQCDVVYNGQEIENIQCPNGSYTVIYDQEDPKNSIMDFKRPAK
jgi:hypothetical protein